MDIRVFPSVVKVVGDDLLAVAIGEEVDRTCGDDANQRWTEALEKCTGGLVTVDIAIAKNRGNK